MILLSQPHITEEDISEVTRVLKSGRLSLGPKLKEFEQKFAELIGTKYAVGVNSGTSGLHLAVRALGIKEGDEVITSPFSFIASANCILYERAKPVFVDIEEDTFNINPDKIEAALTPKTKALLVPHIFGQSCNMAKIVEMAKKHNLKIIEDACESINATHNGQKVGTFGNVAVFAFYPNKQMTTGEGGMIVTNDEEIYQYCKSAANQGRSEDMQWLTHDKLGYNYRLDEMRAALGVVQLNRIEALIKKRQEIAAKYIKELSEIKEIILPKIKPENISTWFVFPIRVKEKIRDKLIQKLNEKGIQSKAYFYPCIHLQPFYQKEFGYQEGMFPVAEKISKETLVLPFYTGMEDGEISNVGKKLKGAISELKEEGVGGRETTNTFNDKIILVTGATGSIGKELVKKLLEFKPRNIRLFDIDESGLFEFQQELSKHDNLRFFVGNIREKDRLKIAMENVDIVFHCAALKHVMLCEYNPLEAVKTNILGIHNIIETALGCNVGKVIFTSSDKATNPNNTMGATKLLGERLLTSANFYRGAKRTVFASVRFGNVVGSRGSVIPLFKKQIKKGDFITLTDPKMTRFIMSIKEAIDLVIKCAELAKGGEIFILKMPAMAIKDIGEVMVKELAEGRDIKTKVIGAKPGETLYEELMTEEEASQIIELEDMFVLLPKIIQKELGIDFTGFYPKPRAIEKSLYISNQAPLLAKEEIKNMLLREGILKNIKY